MDARILAVGDSTAIIWHLATAACALTARSDQRGQGGVDAFGGAGGADYGAVAAGAHAGGAQEWIGREVEIGA